MPVHVSSNVVAGMLLHQAILDSKYVFSCQGKDVHSSSLSAEVV